MRGVERSNDELFGGLRKSLFCSNHGINPRVPSHLVFYRREADRERLPAFFLMTIPSLVIVILSKVKLLYVLKLFHLVKEGLAIQTIFTMLSLV